MTNLLARVLKQGLPAGRKGFSHPPFWSLDNARSPFLTSLSLTGDKEQIENDFEAYIALAYKQNGVVFACFAARQHIFAQADFAWRTWENGRGGELWADDGLTLLQEPGANQSLSELLARMDLIAGLAGNYYATTADDQGGLGKAATGTGQRIAYLRPDWVTIIIDAASGNPYAADAKVVGYRYQPIGGGTYTLPEDAVILLPNEVCAYAPQPDPAARFRGMSWLTPVLREVQSDKAATLHKERFFANGAQFGTVIALKDVDEDGFDEFVEKFNASHKGSENAYKTLFLAGGADVTPLTADLKQLDFKATQGAGETRIAMASGMHPVIVGLSEGLQGSSLNDGNFKAARRLVADKTMRHLWREAASSLQPLVKRPDAKTRLWPDLREVAFLREDARDAAEIQGIESRTIRTLTDAGFKPVSIVDAIRSNDWTRLQHSGLYSVQLQAPAKTAAPAAPAAGDEPEPDDEADEDVPPEQGNP